jgi:type IV pilus secretin PilQ/predicted competence protein
MMRNLRNFVAGGLALMLVVGVLLTVANADQPKDPTQPIKNLQFQAAEIRSVFTFLADYGGVNVVVAPKVQGTVTIKLSDVKWREAMDLIAQTYELAVVEEASGFIRIVPAEDYRREVSEQRKHDAEQQQLVPLETKIVQISNSTSDDVVKAVKSLMTARGQATSDPRSNSIILQEVPTNMSVVQNYISELDKPAKQIKISAQLLEISSTALDELGVKWTVDGSYTSNSGRSVSQTGEVLANRGSDVSGRYTIKALEKGWSATAIVEALVKDGKGKIIAHPEITTLDNKEAHIQMGQKIPVKQFDDAGNVVIKYQDVGSILTVTPHITAENQILMHLKPERSTYEYDANGVIINTNNAETNVIVANQQTAVIGGLTTQDELSSEIGVPFLKDIPLLGYLFKFKQTRTENRDLVIFVTPTIVDANLASKN